MLRSTKQVLTIPDKVEVTTWFTDPLPQGSFGLPNFLRLWNTICVQTKGRLPSDDSEFDKDYSLSISDATRYVSWFPNEKILPAFIGAYPLLVPKDRMPPAFRRSAAPNIQVFHTTNKQTCILSALNIPQIGKGIKDPWELTQLTGGLRGLTILRGFPLFPNSNANLKDAYSHDPAHYVLVSKVKGAKDLYFLALPSSDSLYTRASRQFRLISTKDTNHFDLSLSPENLQLKNFIGSESWSNLHLFSRVDDIFEYGIQGKPQSADYEKLYLHESKPGEQSKMCTAFMVRKRYKETRELIGSGEFSNIEFISKSVVSTKEIKGKIKEDFPELIDEIPEKHGIKWKHLSVFIQNNDHVVYELRKKYRILGASVRLIARISSRIEGSSSKGRITLRQNVLSTSVRFKKSSAAGLLDGLSFNAIDRKLGGVKGHIEVVHMPRIAAAIKSQIISLDFSHIVSQLVSQLDLEVSLKESVKAQYVQGAVYPIYLIHVTKGLPVDQIFETLDRDFEQRKSAHVKQAHFNIGRSDPRIKFEFSD